MPEIYPHLIFNNFSTNLGERVVNILKHLFPVPKVESKRVITFSNNDDLISFRHHTFEKDTYKTVQLNELGPRFEMKIYQISLGLINQP
jgi:U3 small nucleolar ribonucleoprotein protein IMP4